MNKDTNLIYENYEKSVLLEESIVQDIYKKLKEGIHKADLVYILRLIKSRSEYYYKSLMKKVKRYIETGTTGLSSHDKIAQYIILIMMNIVAFPMAVATVAAVDRGFSEVTPYLQKHKPEIVQFIREIETEVGNMKDSVSKLSKELQK
jgi:hypothetical protein